MEQERDYINIGTDWRVGNDAYNLILQKKKIVTSRDKTTKTETWATFGFYSTHKQILHALADEEVKHITDFVLLVEKINDLHRIIESLDIPRR